MLKNGNKFIVTVITSTVPILMHEMRMLAINGSSVILEANIFEYLNTNEKKTGSN